MCNFEDTSWKSKRKKYICEYLWAAYPHVEDSYQNRDKLNKDSAGAKLKSTRAIYRGAVDAGKRSGGGRIAFILFSLCEKVWGGSPAVKSIPSGIYKPRGTNDEGTEENNAKKLFWIFQERK